MLYDYLQYSSRFWKINPGERKRWGHPFSKGKKKKQMHQANPRCSPVKAEIKKRFFAVKKGFPATRSPLGLLIECM